MFYWYFEQLFCMSACPLQICICMAFKLFLLSLVMFSPSFALARPHRYRIMASEDKLTVLSIAYFDWRKSCSRKSFLLRCPRSNYSHNFQCCMYKNVLMFTTFLNYIHTRLSGTTMIKLEACRTRCTGVFQPHGKKSGMDANQIIMFFF